MQTSQTTAKIIAWLIFLLMSGVCAENLPALQNAPPKGAPSNASASDEAVSLYLDPVGDYP